MVLLSGIKPLISIPAPARGRTATEGVLDHSNLFQFPPPRGGEHWDAVDEEWRKIFQFPPPRGGEPPSRRVRRHLDDFNSRPREGANLLRYLKEEHPLISIPAPARGRTSAFQSGNCSMILFQFPPPRGGEPCSGVFPLQLCTFQFPPPRGGEHTGFSGFLLWKDFNSRPREGANSKTAQNRAVYLVSLLKFGRISAILPYILSATRAKKRETPKIIGFLLRRPTGRSCMEQVGAGGVR